MDSFSIPISMLRQFCFCRRIPYLVLVRRLQPPRGDWVKNGTDIHNLISRLLKRRDLSRLGFSGKYSVQSNVHLFSQSQGLHGICDCIITTENDDLFPIEIKAGTGSPSLGIKAQLAAYAMLAEEQLKKTVRKAFVLYESRKSTAIAIDEKLRNQTRKISTAILNDCHRGLLPPSNASVHQCSQCEFQNFCADRL